MKFLRLFTLLILLPLSILAEKKYQISDPIDLPESGLNRVLQMRNGNTLLFHFENRRGILVKVFDSSHKEIASKKILTKTLDLNTLDRTHFDGLHDINSEAVLFLTQYVDNRETLLRLRFNTQTGNLISEEKLVQSPSFKKSITTYVLKNSNDDNYTVVAAPVHLAADTAIDLNVVRYNNKHEIVKEYPFKIGNAQYKIMKLSGCNLDRSGSIMITFNFYKPDEQSDSFKRYFIDVLPT